MEAFLGGLIREERVVALGGLDTSVEGLTAGPAWGSGAGGEGLGKLRQHNRGRSDRVTAAGAAGAGRVSGSSRSRSSDDSGSIVGFGIWQRKALAWSSQSSSGSSSTAPDECPRHGHFPPKPMATASSKAQGNGYAGGYCAGWRQQCWQCRLETTVLAVQVGDNSVGSAGWRQQCWQGFETAV